MCCPLDIALGRRLRQRRRILDLTQAKLAEQLGVRHQQVHKYECGANAVSISKLIQIAEALQTTPAALLEGLRPQEEQ